MFFVFFGFTLGSFMAMCTEMLFHPLFYFPAGFFLFWLIFRSWIKGAYRKVKRELQSYMEFRKSYEVFREIDPAEDSLSA